jgi:hypothetical protein
MKDETDGTLMTEGEVIEGPPLQIKEGGVRDEPPEGFEEKVAEENREYANIYRQNLLSQTAEVIKGISMMHVMAMRGNKEAQQTLTVLWETMRSAGVAFPTNRKSRRRLKAMPGGKAKETEDGGKLPA